jgi:group I intron endonuclease
MIGIYKIINPKGKVYIGQTIDYDRRLRHYRLLKCKEQPKLYASFVEYGYSSHNISLIKECLVEELTKWERHFQEMYDSVGKNGLNCILVRDEHFTGGHSEESKKKISDSLKGRKFSEEHRRKIAEANRRRVITDEHRYNLGNGNRGKKQNQEWLDKLIKVRTGQKRTEETKVKMSESAKNRVTEEWKQNIRNKLKNRVVSEETRLKMSEAAKNRKNRIN